MLVLNRGQRELLADNLLDAANLAVLLDYFGRRQQRKAQRTAGGSNSSPHASDFWP